MVKAVMVRRVWARSEPRAEASLCLAGAILIPGLAHAKLYRAVDRLAFFFLQSG